MIISSSYQRPAPLFNKHLETIFPAILRRSKSLQLERERIDTPDNDFLDLDWFKSESKTLAILSHGLEGNSRKAYMTGMAKALKELCSCDALLWNFRGCSGEINRNDRFYHSGETQDLHFVIEHALSKNIYDQIILIGFSLGGNVTLKYLGENPSIVPAQVIAAATVSVPLDLAGCSERMKLSSNNLYSQRFLRNLKGKVRKKPSLAFLKKDLRRLKEVFDFDDVITGPLHGFANAEDYYQKCSSINFLKTIELPVLILNAKNDPFLPETCFPKQLLKTSPNIVLDIPTQGGHVGFSSFFTGYYWSEMRVCDWVEGVMGTIK